MAEEPNKDSPPPPIRVEIEQAPAFVNEYRSNERENRRRENRRFWVEVLTLGALIGYAILVFIQWKELQLSNNLAQYALSDSAMRAREANTETRKSLELTRQANEGGQRAWLTVREARWTLAILRLNGHAEITIVIENTGRSPAQHVRSLSMADVQLPTFLIPKRLQNPTGPISTTVIGPGQRQPITFKREKALTQDELNCIIAGNCVIYYAAHITYSDQFSKDRELRTCHQFDPSDQNTLTVCPQHNSVK